MTRPPPGHASRNFTDPQLSLTSRRRPPLPEMNQIQEKIKDLVDVRSNEQLDDFLADLSQTLSGYYFTDITSDLMAKWIDRVVVMPTGSGNAFALAGYRGVGKSHFLAAFGAILSQPDLRAKLKDSHVFASAERLIRRHYPVVNVRRGTGPTLLDELRSAVATAFDAKIEEVGETPSEIVRFTSEKGGAGPSILVIDTDIEREARVSRDDGGGLSAIAEAAEGTNVFVAVALDDDVATADGRNSSIARNFRIDYLDNEHLYKIIDANIFPKNHQRRSTLTTIHENFKQVLPSFRWSEQRMASVYPLHPVILEAAPFVRLFIQDFALLAFASQAGAKSVNRPADSLIALDELFDSVEKSLRRSTDLEDVFASYDELNEAVVSKAPVMERLRARLVLKGLLMLSLDSEGATAADIAAAMLIFDERDPKSASSFVENLLEKFVTAAEGRLWRMEREGRAVKYGFNLSGKEHFNTALSEAVQAVPDSVIPNLLRRLMRDRYGDCEFTVSGDGEDVAPIAIEWRGGVRPGRLIWNVRYNDDKSQSRGTQTKDWEILIDLDGAAATPGLPFIKWKADHLKPEEFDTLKRYHALMSREDLQQAFRDEVRTSIQTYTIAIEKIWERKFLQYGKLLIDGSEYNFTPSAVSGHNLSEVLASMLAPHLDEQYPEHPFLAGRLEMSSVDQLSTGLFAARESVSPEVRKLAEAFAVPLGLAEIVDGSIEIRSVEVLLALNSVSTLMEVLSTTEGPVKMATVQHRLGARPFGLTVEAQCLILTALVARGMVEFVTKNGDRIGSRSLDLKLVWDDVAGVAVPVQTVQLDDQTVRWAALLTGNEKLRSIGTDAGREAVKQALSAWLGEWNSRKLLEKLDAISDDVMTTEIWHLGARLRKSFGAAADAVSAFISGSVDLESALRRCQEAFSSSDTEFAARKLDIEALESLLQAIPFKSEVRSRLAYFEPTGEEPIENDRVPLTAAVENRNSIAGILKSTEARTHWINFQANYNEFISHRHESSARSHEHRDRSNEILASHEWWVFENLSSVDQFPTRFRRIVKEVLREIRKCNCTNEIALTESRSAFCPVCGFTAKTDRVRSALCVRLWETVNQALVAYDHVLARLAIDVAEAAMEFAASSGSESILESASAVGDKLKHGISVADFTEDELRMLILSMRRMQVAIGTRETVEETITPVITGEEIVEDAVVVH